MRDDGILDVHDTVIGRGPDDQPARWGVVSLYLTEKCGVDSDGVLTAEIRHSRNPLSLLVAPLSKGLIPRERLAALRAVGWTPDYP